MTNQTTATLYFCSRQLDAPLTIGLLESLSADYANEFQLAAPIAFSLEPTSQLPVINGEITPGRIKDFAPLMLQLPKNLANLPLQSAAIHGENYWINFTAKDELSGIPAKAFLWFTEKKDACEPPIDNLEVTSHAVLPWQDRDRFNLTQDSGLPNKLWVRHYLQNGKRLTWQLAFNNKELNHEEI